jgi:hypothetical protein
MPFFNISIKCKSIKTASKRYIIGNAKNVLTANIKDFKYSDIIAILKFSFITLEESRLINAEVRGKAFSKLTKAAEDEIYSFKTTYNDWLLLLQRRALSLQRSDQNRRNL